jgi:hypothetical protein
MHPESKIDSGSTSYPPMPKNKHSCLRSGDVEAAGRTTGASRKSRRDLDQSDSNEDSIEEGHHEQDSKQSNSGRVV